VRPAPRAAARRKTWLVVAAIAAAVLLAGAAVAVFYFGVGGLIYPKKYLLDADEAPRGLQLAPSDFASQDGRCEAETNPCQLGADSLDELGRVGKRPKEAWAEGFETPGPESETVTIVAIKFASTDDANAWVARGALACSENGAHGAILQDGDVVVALTAPGQVAGVYKDKAVTALLSKVSGLVKKCSR
jgi:hypothetical protein